MPQKEGTSSHSERLSPRAIDECERGVLGPLTMNVGTEMELKRFATRLAAAQAPPSWQCRKSATTPSTTAACAMSAACALEVT